MRAQIKPSLLIDLNGYRTRVTVARCGSSDTVTEFAFDGAPAPRWNGAHQDTFPIHLLADLIGFACRIATAAAAQVVDSGDELEVTCPFDPELLYGQPYDAWTEAYWGARMTHFRTWTVARRDTAGLLQAPEGERLDRTIQWMPGCMVVMDRTIQNEAGERMDRTVHALAA